MQVAAITYLCALIITFLIQQMPALFLALNGNEWQVFFSFAFMWEMFAERGCRMKQALFMALI